MIKALSAAIVLVGAATLPVTVSGQSSIGIRGYAVYGNTALSSSESFEVVSGSSSHAGLGGGGTVTGLWRGLFVDAAYSQTKINGERVFLDGRTVYRLGIPLRATVKPLDIASGWRFSMGRFSPYVAGGVSFISYKESSPFSEPGDDFTERGTGALLLGGLDVAVIRWIHVGGELRYRAVKGALGSGGVSENFGEDQLGGVSAAVRVSVGN